MTLHNTINKLRCDAHLSQEQFAALFGVSRQSVQKWENGTATPDLDKLVALSKYFDISLDALIMGNDTRLVEEMKYSKTIKPHYESIHNWEFYPAYLPTEYEQSVEEGLDVEKYKDLFAAVSRLPKDEIKKKLGDVLFEIVISAPQREGYRYVEPSDIDAIRALCKPYPITGAADPAALPDKIHGAWMGRICGCLLGKTVEGIRTDELVPFLKETGNYPMYRYILHSDLNDDILQKYKFPFANRAFADRVNGMPVDDDTNYMVLDQLVIEKFGREFTPLDMAHAWLSLQPKDAYCTAERVAFCNFVKGYEPPKSAVYKNPFREWIGAQIRGDYFGYINPGNPAAAADMAFRDASVSHIKNGIYGEMFAAAMIACAAVTDNISDMIKGGLAEIPHTSRLYEAVTDVLDGYESGVTQADCFADIHKRWDEYTEHGWCHTIPNAMIVAAALLYGGGDYGKSVCMAVETGFDTDCNGATVGSVIGMAQGLSGIPAEWRAPVGDTLHTSIFGVTEVKISECAHKTLSHLK